MRLSLVGFFVLLVGYGLYEASSLVWGPQITLPQGAVVVSEPYAAVRGVAENVSSLYLNGTIVSLTEEGAFEKTVNLTPGTNRFLLTAHDKYGRTREEALDILYIASPDSRRPPPRASAPTPATTTP